MKLNVEFNPSQSETLQRVAGELGESQAGVLRAALALVALVVREQQAGNTLGVVRSGRLVKEIAPLWSLPASVV